MDLYTNHLQVKPSFYIIKGRHLLITCGRISPSYVKDLIHFLEVVTNLQEVTDPLDPFLRKVQSKLTLLKIAFPIINESLVNITNAASVSVA